MAREHTDRTRFAQPGNGVSQWGDNELAKTQEISGSAGFGAVLVGVQVPQPTCMIRPVDHQVEGRTQGKLQALPLSRRFENTKAISCRFSSVFVHPKMSGGSRGRCQGSYPRSAAIVEIVTMRRLLLSHRTWNMAHSASRNVVAGTDFSSGTASWHA